MICATILTLAFVSASNVYSEESYIVDIASEAKVQATDTQSIDCAMNTADVKLESDFYWDGSNEELAKYLKSYSIVVDLDQLDSMEVTQGMIAEADMP